MKQDITFNREKERKRSKKQTFNAEVISPKSGEEATARQWGERNPESRTPLQEGRRLRAGREGEKRKFEGKGYLENSHPASFFDKNQEFLRMERNDSIGQQRPIKCPEKWKKGDLY